MIFRGFRVFEYDIIIIHRPKLFQLFQTNSLRVENGLPGFYKRGYTFIHL